MFILGSCCGLVSYRFHMDAMVFFRVLRMGSRTVSLGMQDNCERYRNMVVCWLVPFVVFKEKTEQRLISESQIVVVP